MIPTGFVHALKSMSGLYRALKYHKVPQEPLRRKKMPSPYATKESPQNLWFEQTIHGGIHIGGIAYGKIPMESSPNSPKSDILLCYRDAYPYLFHVHPLLITRKKKRELEVAHLCHCPFRSWDH